MSKKETNGKQTRGKPFEKGNKIGNRWKPGESGNPNGRRNAMSDIIRRILDAEEGKVKEELSLKLIEYAQKAEGDNFLKAIDRIIDRTEGKPTQPTADVSDGWQKFLEGVFVEDEKE